MPRQSIPTTDKSPQFTMMNPSALIAALLGETLSSQERLVGFQPANVGRVGRPGAGPERKRIFLCEGE